MNPTQTTNTITLPGFGAATRTTICTTYETFIAGTPVADSVELEQAAGGGVRGWWVWPQGRTQPFQSAILYLHDGAFVLGSAAAYRGFASQIAMLLEQRPPLRGENGESWHPSAGKH